MSLALLDYYPLPNQPGSSLANNYLAVNDDWTDKDQFNTRIDFTESSKSSWYGRYGWTKEGVYTGGIRLNGSTVDTRAQQALIDNTRVLNSTLVNEIRFGYNRFYNAAGSELNNVLDATKAVGIPLPTPVPPEAWGLPAIGVAGFSGFGADSNSPYINQNQNWQFTENLSWNRGAHFVRVGADVRLDHYNQDGNQFARGSAGFNNNVATGYGAADFMLGYIGTWSYASGLAVARLKSFSQCLLHQRHVEGEGQPDLEPRPALRIYPAVDRHVGAADYCRDSSEYASNLRWLTRPASGPGSRGHGRFL